VTSSNFQWWPGNANSKGMWQAIGY
jgi:hypothetical protein